MTPFRLLNLISEMYLHNIAPIVAVFLGWTILDESVTYLTIIATIVILIGVALIVRTLNNK
jgi:drug/metabolite transporter (DMT)-like permease